MKIPLLLHLIDVEQVVKAVKVSLMEFDQIQNWRKSHFHKFDEVDQRKYINLLKYVESIIYIKMMKMTK